MPQLWRRKPARPQVKAFGCLLGTWLAEQLDHIPATACSQEDQQNSRGKKASNEHQIQHKHIRKCHGKNIHPTRGRLPEPDGKRANTFLSICIDFVDVLAPVEAAETKPECH